VPEIKDTVFAKTSPKHSFSMTEYERFGLVFTKTRSINSDTGANVIIWDKLLSSGMKCNYGANFIILDYMLSSGMQCYHLELMLSSGKK
jgi:hypothetical protein